MKEFYTIKEFCEIFRISRSTFDRKVKNGEITLNKNFGKYLINKSEVEKFMGK